MVSVSSVHKQIVNTRIEASNQLIYNFKYICKEIPPTGNLLMWEAVREAIATRVKLKKIYPDKSDLHFCVRTKLSMSSIYSQAASMQHTWGIHFQSLQSKQAEHTDT